MEENNKKKNNKKQMVILLSVFLLLCISGVGIFFLVNRQTGTVETDDEFVYTGKWDVSWYNEDEDEYTITTREQLFGLSDLSQDMNFKGKTIKLGADIVINEGNAKDWSEEKPEYSWTPIGRDKMPFNGTFDGQGHSISGIYLNISDEQAGFFAATDDASQIINTSIVNSYYKMRGDQGVGTFACRGAGLYSRLYTDAIIDCEGWNAGGIMAYKKNKGVGTISECWFDGSINITGRMAGGISGKVYQGGCTIQHCLNTGNIYSTFPGPQAATIGGICGNVSQLLTITDCFSSGLLVNEVGRPEVATIIGSVSKAGDITAGLNWSTREGAPSSVGTINSDATVVGTFFQLPEKLLTGYEAYKRTDLNFEQYWAVVEDGTPMLQYFADTIPSVAGLERAMTADTSWFNPTQREFVLTTPEQLKGFAILSTNGQSFYGYTIKLGADIVYNEGKAKNYDENVPLNMWIPLIKFMGTFDGQGHTISGLYVGGATDHVGMFASTEKQAVLKNFNLKNSYFESTTTNTNYGTASIVGAGGGTIERIYSDAIVVTSCRFGAGIIGLFNKDGAISECWFDGEVAAAGRRSGGIAGGCYPYYVLGSPVITTTTISHCLNTGYIHRTDKSATDSATSGGIVGVINKNNKTIIEDCFSAGIVTSPKYESGKNDELGAICSAIAEGGNGTIKNCWGTIQSYKKLITTIKDTAVSDINMSQVLDKNLVTGYGAVRLTTLNFNKYWAVDLDGTPILKYFAKSVPSIAGVILPDTSWYNAKKSEFVITTVEQLFGFSVLANSGVTFEGKTVKLGNSITVNTGDASTWKETAPTNNWFPIKDFAGTFDGQGYTISGIYSVDSVDEQIGRGLFSKTVASAVIKNFKLVNSYFQTNTIYALGAISSRGAGTFQNIYTDAILSNVGGGSTGGIIGYVLWDEARVENCWFDGSITDTGQRMGGIVGRTQKNGTTMVHISHCLFSGSITRVVEGSTSSSALAGGIMGSASDVVSISDCLSVGTLSSTRTKTDNMGSLVGETVQGANVTLQNLYASESTWTKLRATNAANADESTCYKISDVCLIGENASLFTKLDFANYWAVVKDGTPELKTLAKGSVVSNPKTFDTSWYTDGSYVIRDESDLYGLRMLSVTETFEGKKISLGANITVNQENASGYQKNAPAYVWTPIQNFAGEFDGNGYEISGLYGKVTDSDTKGIALFTNTAKTANIHDFSLVNTYFENAGKSGVAGVVARGQGTYQNIHTDAILYSACTDKIYAGGIVGIATGTLVVEDCWSSTDISGAGRYAGGILGYANEYKVNIAHCLNSGTLYRFGACTNFADYGGIVGSATATKVVTVEDCLNTGTIHTEKSGTEGTHKGIGHIVGEGPNANAKLIIKDSYATSGSVYNNIGTFDVLVGVFASKASVTDSSVQVADSMKGEDAFWNTTLDFKFDYHWALLGDATTPAQELPVLKAFHANTTDYLYGLVKYDTSWYNTSTDKGTITDRWDLYGLYTLYNDGELSSSSVISLGNNIVVNAMADGVSVSTWETNAPEYTWTTLPKFEGTLNGKGYGIYGLYNNSFGTKEIAFIKQLTSGAAIKNLTFDNCYIAGGQPSAIIASKGYGTFEKVHIGKNVILHTSGSLSGGFIGNIEGDTKISECWFEGNIHAENPSGKDLAKWIGGFVGQVNTGTTKIYHSLSNGSVTRTNGSGDGQIGGMVGKIASNGTLEIDDCLHLGSVQSDKEGDVAGLILGYINSDKRLTYDRTYSIQHEESNATRIAGVSSLEVNNGDWIVDISAIKGTDIAQEKIKLNFNKYWTMVDNSSPALTAFCTNVEELEVDETWFNTSENQGTISNAKQLYGFASLASRGVFNTDSVVTLSTDIVVNELAEGVKISDWANSEYSPNNEWTPITNFAGTFNGQNHTIYGLYGVSESDENGMGLFANTTADAEIKNLTIDNCYFEIQSGSGLSAVSTKGGGTFSNIHIGRNVLLQDTLFDTSKSGKTQGGGILGYANVNSDISQCWFEGTIVSQDRLAGGIVGELEKNSGITVKISHCLSNGTLTRNSGGNTNGNFGGFVGKVENGTTLIMDDCLHLGVVSSPVTNSKGATADEIGLFVGACTNSGTLTVTRSYSIAKTESTTHLGQLENVVGGGSNAMTQYNTGAHLVDVSKITGTSIDTDIVTLDFVNSWIMVEGSTPTLKAFPQ